jgi:flagellar assembly protein FliH
MSLETRFSPADFPSFSSAAQDRADAHSNAAGHAAGYAAGLRAAGAELAGQKAALDAEHRATIAHANARLARTLATLAVASAALDARLLPIIADAQQTIAVSAIDLAEAIIGVELSDADHAAAAAVTRALASVDPGRIHSVRLNPLDLALLDDSVRSTASITFVADATVARGDAVADLAVGYVDARISTAVERARRALLGEPS